MITPKRNVCVSFTLSNTHLKMYGIGAEIDEIRENATIDVSIDISWPNVNIAFRFLEHVQHIIDHTCAKFEYDLSRRNGITCILSSWNWKSKMLAPNIQFWLPFLETPIFFNPLSFKNYLMKIHKFGKKQNTKDQIYRCKKLNQDICNTFLIIQDSKCPRICGHAVLFRDTRFM